MYQIICHSEYLGHIQHRRFFKFIPRTYLQTAGWLIARLELWTPQPCLTNLPTEISLTFELHWQTWPSYRSRLHALIPLTCRCPSLSLSFTSPALPLHQTTSKREYSIQPGAEASPAVPFCTCGEKWISRWWFGPLHGSHFPVCPPAAEVPTEKTPDAFKCFVYFQKRTFLCFYSEMTEISMQDKKKKT